MLELPFLKPKPMRGILALYDNPDEILTAAALVTEHGFRNVDAYTPYPVHGLSEEVEFARPRGVVHAEDVQQGGLARA